MPERLLPVGPHRDFTGLVEHVRQVLGVREIEGNIILIIKKKKKTNQNFFSNNDIFLNLSDSNKYNNGNSGKTDGQAPIKQDSTTSENMVICRTFPHRLKNKITEFDFSVSVSSSNIERDTIEQIDESKEIDQAGSFGIAASSDRVLGLSRSSIRS